MSWLFSVHNLYKYLLSARKGNKRQKIVLLISDLRGVKMDFYKNYINEYEDCQKDFWSLCDQLRSNPELHELHDEYIDKYREIIADAELAFARQDLEDSFFPECPSRWNPWDSFQTMQLLKELNSEYRFKLITNI